MSVLQEEIKFYLNNILEKNVISEEEINKYIRKSSIIDELKLRKKVNDDFIKMLNRLTLEEILLLKLETISNKTKTVMPMKMFGIVKEIVGFVVVKYAISSFNTIDEVLVYLGVSKAEYEKIKENIIKVQVGNDGILQKL